LPSASKLFRQLEMIKKNGFDDTGTSQKENAKSNCIIVSVKEELWWST
jgi:hypothetical protein